MALFEVVWSLWARDNKTFITVLVTNDNAKFFIFTWKGADSVIQISSHKKYSVGTGFADIFVVVMCRYFVVLILLLYKICKVLFY